MQVPMHRMVPGSVFLLTLLWAARVPSVRAEGPLELEGVSVIPHVQSDALRYRRPPEPGLGARVQLFLRNASPSPLTLGPDWEVALRGKSPGDHLKSGDWTWHDFPEAWTSNTTVLPPGHLTVWTFNSRGTNWGLGTAADLRAAPPKRPASAMPISLDRPRVWISSVTFLGTNASLQPDSLIVHVANDRESPLTLRSLRLWLADPGSSGRSLAPGPVRILEPGDCFPKGGTIPPRDRGGFRLTTGPLPLSYSAIEIRGRNAEGIEQTLWAYLRIKREVFDISGGWVADGLHGSNTLHSELYLKTLKRLHVNAGMHQDVPGYTDNPELYARYPLKSMNRCQPFERFDTDEGLSRIHAVEFLGEPQFGRGRPVPPMEVWRALAPYRGTRLPTSVTHSEERIWRLYAGLSDYPHYDAYRVTAPAPDAWSQYDRWGGAKIRWGAPLETIGDMTRSLRDLNRPSPVAYWSQGAHDGWDRIGSRSRTSPTSDELRMQAYHGISSRITSLYWFNLSLKSLVAFRDLMEPIARIGREVRLLAPLLLEGDAYHYERQNGTDGKPQWDLASVCGPSGALLFALDLNYAPDPAEKVFRFGPDRAARFRFPMPAYLLGVKDVFRVDADGIHDVPWKHEGGTLVVEDRTSRAAIYVASQDRAFRTRWEVARLELLREEASVGFDPAGNDPDFLRLAALLGAK